MQQLTRQILVIHLRLATRLNGNVSEIEVEDHHYLKTYEGHSQGEFAQID